MHRLRCLRARMPRDRHLRRGRRAAGPGGLHRDRCALIQRPGGGSGEGKRTQSSGIATPWHPDSETAHRLSLFFPPEFPTVLNLRLDPFWIGPPILPALVERWLSGQQSCECPLTFRADPERLLGGVYALFQSLCELVFVLPAPRGHVRLNHEVERLVHIVKSNRRPAKRLLQVDIPAQQVPPLAPDEQARVPLSGQNQAKGVFGRSEER